MKQFRKIKLTYQKQPPEVFCKKGVLKKETLAQVFSCEFCEISKNTFFTEHLWTTASDISQLDSSSHVYWKNCKIQKGSK